LRSAECGRPQAEDERGWKAHGRTRPEDDPMLIVFCPECAGIQRGAMTARAFFDNVPR
jgi:hypothetical protein